MVLSVIGFLLMVSLSMSRATQPYEVVISYLNNLQVCLETGSNIFVKDVVEGKIYKRLQIWLDAWRYSGYKIKAKLLKVQILKQSVDKSNAEIITSENWVYRYLYLSTEENAFGPQKIQYKVLYKLNKKNDNRWKIHSIKILKEVKYECGRNCE